MNKIIPKTLNVRPLTRKNLNGEVYKRLDVVEAQIDECLRLDNDELIERIMISDHRAQEFIQEECLVALIRASLSCHNDELAYAFFKVLFDRSAGFIYNQLKFEDQDKRDRAYDEVISKLTEIIIDINTNKADYFQVRFWVAVKRLAINTFNYFLRDPLENTIVISQENNLHEFEYKDYKDISLNEISDQETLEHAKTILSQLSQRHLDVFFLRYKEDWPIESNDPNKITLSKYFGVSSRTIRNWLYEGEAALKKELRGK